MNKFFWILLVVLVVFVSVFRRRCSTDVHEKISYSEGIRGRGGRDSDIQTFGPGEYRRVEFGMTADEGRNAEAVKYEMSPTSELEGFKIVCEFFADALKNVSSCRGADEELLDGLKVYNQLIPHRDILFKQESAKSKIIEAHITLGLFPMSKTLCIKIESPYYINPHYQIKQQNSILSSDKSIQSEADQRDLIDRFNKQRLLIEFISRTDAINIETIEDKQVLVEYLYDLFTKNYNVYEIRDAPDNTNLFMYVVLQ